MTDSRQYRLRRYAHAYAEAEVRILPCHWIREDGSCSCGQPSSPKHKLGKHPLTRRGVLEATDDHRDIESWWKDDPLANIAIVPGPIPGTDDEWFVLDLDHGWRLRNGQEVFLDGPADLRRLEDEYGSIIDEQIAQRSGSGAKHLILKKPRGLRMPGFLTKAIDVIGGGGKYILAAPSNHVSGNEYEWLNPPRDGEDFVFRFGEALRKIEMAPQWLLDFDPHGHAPRAMNGHSHGDGEDLIRASRDRGTDLTKTEFEDALALVPNDDAPYETYLNIIFAVHREAALRDDLEWGERIAEDWARKSHKFDQDDFDHRWSSTYDDPNRKLKGGRFVLHLATLEGGWRAPARRAKDDIVARLNEKHALVNMGGKILVLNKPRAGAFPNFSTIPDLHNRYTNDTVQLKIKGEKKDKEITVPSSKVWMGSKERDEYMEGIVFKPSGKCPAETYNLWQGWSVKPSNEGSCKMFLDHIFNVVCNRDLIIYDWLINWMADIIQNPGRKAGTAVGLKGTKGAGKDITGVYLGSLFEPNHIPISDPEHLTGRFNSHFCHALLLHMEEGFYAGSHKSDSVLKHIITSDKMMIEFKYANATIMPTCFRILMTSNAEQLVKATSDERRYLILEVSEERKGDKRYFEDIVHEMKHGGSEALLYFLQHRDLSSFDVRNPPMTDALRDQKQEGFTNIEKWWFEILAAGQLPGSTAEYWEEGSVRVERDRLRESYDLWMKENRYQGNKMDAAKFGKWFRTLVPDIQTARLGSRGERNWFYVIPARERCRTVLDERLGRPVEWDI